MCDGCLSRFFLVNLRCFLNRLVGLDLNVKHAMGPFLVVSPRHVNNIAVDAVLNSYVYVLCTTCDVWFNCCCEFCNSSLSLLYDEV